MIPFFTVLYAVLVSVLVNSYVFANSFLKTTLCIVLFILLNLCAGLFSVKSKKWRLRLLSHGTTLLIAFCASLTVSIPFQILMIVFNSRHSVLILVLSVIYCISCNYIIFWNGIICVYLSSVQLGIKTRVIGAICGCIPIVNLAVLGVIIHKCYKEVSFESEKERINDLRRNEKVCKTKYPILFVHGVFFRDSKALNYWGRIPKELEKNGAACYYGEHQSALSIKDGGEEIAKKVKEITEKTGCGKVNIIAHSKGGLDCRYAIENCGIAPLVASLTTINTPHRGCVFAEWLLKKAPESMKNSVAASYNKAARIIGDTEPDFIAAVSDLTAEFCREFDKNTKAPYDIYCQSVGSVIEGALSGKFPLNLSHAFVKYFDGKNDGLVGVDSFEWGSNYTLLDLGLKRGISHADMIDLNRENIDGFDVREFYVNLVNDLKNKGL